MKINVRPIAPAPIPATELKAGDKFTTRPEGAWSAMASNLYDALRARAGLAQ